MKQNHALYHVIGWVAILAMPAAAAGNFGLAAYEALAGRAPGWFAIGVGGATAVGLEATGIIVGRVATSAYAQRDRPRLAAAALGMLLYVILPTVELAAIPFARFVPVLAALAYVARALMVDVEKAEIIQDARTAAQWQHELQQDAADREVAREIKRQRALAKIDAQYAAHGTHDAPQSAPKAPAYACACGETFASPQAYAAHKRWHCALVSANGHKEAA